MILDRILATLPLGTAIPKPVASGVFTIKGEGTAYGERALIYTIPNLKHPDRPRQKGVTSDQLDAAFNQLHRSGQLTRQWWNEHVRRTEDEGGCNFTTVGGIFSLLGEAEYAGPGVYKRKT